MTLLTGMTLCKQKAGRLPVLRQSKLAIFHHVMQILLFVQRPGYDFKTASEDIITMHYAEFI